VALLAVAVVGCAAAEGPAADQHLDVALSDFAIVAERDVVAPGLTEFRAFNEGPTVHELIVVRTDLAPDALPLQDDGLTAVEEAPGVEFVLADEGIDLGERGGFSAPLQVGRYVLYCNLEGHYLGGMRTGLDVREDAP
jgi:uncharacterized cupredoxin-like copper-binding protein